MIRVALVNSTTQSFWYLLNKEKAAPKLDGFGLKLFVDKDFDTLFIYLLFVYFSIVYQMHYPKTLLLYKYLKGERLF